MNKVAENLTGWSLIDAKEKKIDQVFRIISEIDREPALNPVERVINEGIVIGLANHTLLINKNGREIPIGDSASPIKDEDDNVIGCVLVFQDQTRLREYQIAIEESESKYRTTIESMDDGIYVVDNNLNVVLMNQRFKSWLKDLGCIDDLDYQDMKLKDLKIFVNDEIVNEVTHTFRTLKSSFKEEEYLINGKKIFTETKRIAIKSIDSPTKVVTIIRDITDQKNAEEALKESEIRYRRLHESMTDSFVQVSMSGEITDVNRSYLKMLSYTREEILGLKYTDITPEVWWDYEKNIIETEIMTLGYSDVYEKEYIRKDGTCFPVELRTYLLHDKDERPIGMWAIVRDITERKLAEALIQQKNLELTNSLASKDKFFSIIAHDLKGPLSGFVMLSKILAEEFNTISSEEMEELSLTLHNSSDNLYKLLENLLEWSLVNNGTIEIKPILCNIYTIVQNNMDAQSVNAKQKKIKLINKIEEQTTVFADLSMTNTIFRNLISNAIKFTPNGGSIEIGVQNLKVLDSFKECFYIRDNGIGISQDLIEKLFKIDQKVTRLGTDNEPSTGLGLILCKEFIEKNGGTIWVESELGKGTTFYFTLNKNLVN